MINPHQGVTVVTTASKLAISYPIQDMDVAQTGPRVRGPGESKRRRRWYLSILIQGSDGCETLSTTTLLFNTFRQHPHRTQLHGIRLCMLTKPFSVTNHVSSLSPHHILVNTGLVSELHHPGREITRRHIKIQTPHTPSIFTPQIAVWFSIIRTEHWIEFKGYSASVRPPKLHAVLAFLQLSFLASMWHSVLCIVADVCQFVQPEIHISYYAKTCFFCATCLGVLEASSITITPLRFCCHGLWRFPSLLVC